MPQTYTVLKNKIKSKLEAITKIQEVTDNPKLQFNGYPAAIVIPSEQENEYETNTENQRAYSFDISIYYEIQDSGISDALDSLYDLVDDVLDTFDQDYTLTGIVLPSKYTMIQVKPVSNSWGILEENDLIVATLKIKVILSIDIT